MTRTSIILAALAISCGSAHAESEFCRDDLGLQPGTEKYSKCEQSISTLYDKMHGSTDANRLPLDVRYEMPDFDRSGMLFEIALTARADSVTITGIKVNRGNCIPTMNDPAWKGSHPLRVPYTLKFGQRYFVRWFIMNGCVPLEVEVSTDRGDYAYTFER